MPQDKFGFITDSPRDGGEIVELENDGYIVFAFDESARDTIRKADPAIVWSVGRNTLDDVTTTTLLSEGQLLTYALIHSNVVKIEFYVGAPLTEAERRGGPWYPPERALLSIPSGRLSFHTYNTLPMGDNGDEPEEEGATVDVPPGDYVATVYRKNFDAIEDLMEEAEESGVDVYWNVTEFVVLTPIADAKPLDGGSTLLFKECVGL